MEKTNPGLSNKEIQDWLEENRIFDYEAQIAFLLEQLIYRFPEPNRSYKTN